MTGRLTALLAVLLTLGVSSVATASQAPGYLGHLAADESSAVAPAPLDTTRSGFVFVDADGPVAGNGKLRTYRLEVEPETGVNPRLFTMMAERILNDERAWIGVDDLALQRVSEPDADIRIVLATPGTVDRMCAQAGLDTGGEVSCWNGRYAALNHDRWTGGANGFDGSLRTYRRYLLNHEVGHALGYRHRTCPEKGAPAPVMQQQTYATKPCDANGWPTVAH